MKFTIEIPFTTKSLFLLTSKLTHSSSNYPWRLVNLQGLQSLVLTRQIFPPNTSGNHNGNIGIRPATSRDTDTSRHHGAQFIAPSNLPNIMGPNSWPPQTPRTSQHCDTVALLNSATLQTPPSQKKKCCNWCFYATRPRMLLD